MLKRLATVFTMAAVAAAAVAVVAPRTSVMAFTNRTTVPVSWNADGRNYWHYQRTAID